MQSKVEEHAKRHNIRAIRARNPEALVLETRAEVAEVDLCAHTPGEPCAVVRERGRRCVDEGLDAAARRPARKPCFAVHVEEGHRDRQEPDRIACERLVGGIGVHLGVWADGRRAAPAPR